MRSLLFSVFLVISLASCYSIYDVNEGCTCNQTLNTDSTARGNRLELIWAKKKGDLENRHPYYPPSCNGWSQEKTSTVFAGGELIVATDDYIIAMNPDDGQLLWKTRVRNLNFPSYCQTWCVQDTFWINHEMLFDDNNLY